jgi:2-methylcitrate dehydratase PrpD
VTIARQLAEWATGLRLAAVPVPVRDIACRHLLDGLGTAVGALRLGEARPAVAVARGLGGPPESTVLGGDERLGAPAAALAVGALVHALDFDDTHADGLVHATAVTLPAALAVGEQYGASGAEVLTAALAGYEVTCRIAAAVPHGFHARGLHATGIAGALGSAVVAARLAGLDADTATNALGIAGSGAGGLLEFLSTGASTKQLHPGLASYNGILAARLAAAGATGPDSVLEGRYGIWAALSAHPADPARALRGLGAEWEVTRITMKPYPVCQLSHATLDAAAQIRTDPADVVGIEAYVHPDSVPIVCEPAEQKIRPRTPYEAKFSLPWCVAALMLDGRLGVGSFTEAALSRPEVTALAERVRSLPTAGGTVAAEAPGRVVVELRDGRRLVGSAPHQRFDDEALLAKVTDLVGDNGPKLAGRVRGLAGLPDLSPLLDDLAACGSDR